MPSPSTVPLHFWQTLPRPAVGLSPMDGVTDAAFRSVTVSIAKPDVLFTEFVAAEGIAAGATKLLEDFTYDPVAERPIVAQLFGADPAAFECAAAVVAALGFDGVDVNMGCPARRVAAHGGGAALIEDPVRAVAILQACRRGVARWAAGEGLEAIGAKPKVARAVAERRHALGLSGSGDVADARGTAIPVSLKTRLGVREVVAERWVNALLEAQPDAITLHGRTLAQGYSGVADWEVIARAAALIHASGLPTVVFGNGDVVDRADAQERAAQYGVDGVLIGRAALGNPWAFLPPGALAPTPQERLETAVRHVETFLRLRPEGNFVALRKHLLWYARAFPHAKDLRERFARVSTLEEVRAAVAEASATLEAHPQTI